MEQPDSASKIASLSVVFPAYNDYATIPSMVLSAIHAARQVTSDYEVIVTDDGSQDATAMVLDELSTRLPELRVIHHTHNQGYGCALRSGFAAATKDWVFYTDGDAQYDPLELVNLVRALKPGVDVVNGYKISRGDIFMRRFVGRLYHYSVKWLFRFQLRDVDCDFRLFRRDILDRVTLVSENGTICVELVKKFQAAGYRFKEIPVHHYPRPYGVSQFFRWRNFWISGKSLIRLYKDLVLRP